MSNSFAITTTTNSISLGNSRQGQASFTVSNTTNHPVRGRARIVAQPASASPWLALQGEVEHDFATNDSQQYSVQLTVPPTGAVGDYTFRLDMVNVADPDDDFSEGPTVKFTVAAPAPVPVKPFPWWIVAVAVGVLIILSGGIYGIVQLTAPKHVTITPTPTVAPTPTPTVNLSGTWQGQGTYTSTSTGTFTMLLTITSVNGNTFSGTLTENTYNSTVAITGTIIGASNSGVTITFTDPKSISGGGIALNVTYTAVVANGQMNGFWHYAGQSAPNGTISLSKTA